MVNGSCVCLNLLRETWDLLFEDVEDCVVDCVRDGDGSDSED